MASSRDMRHVRRITIALGIIAGLLVLVLVFGTGRSESRDRKVAAGLIELHRQWETHDNIPALFESLTNLPFHDGGVRVGKGSVSRRHGVMGIKWEEYYFIHQPQPETNATEWTLYHAWYWYPPKGVRREMVKRKLLTLTPP